MTEAFFEQLARAYDGQTGREAKAYFNNMGLPIPQSDYEYYRTTDAGRMLFLNDYSCVVRFTDHKRKPLISSPRIIQPLGTKFIGKLRADILPGINLCDEPDSAKKFKDIAAKEEGLNFFDDHPMNCGTLPKISDAIPADYIVVLDLGAVDKLYISTGNIKNLLAKAAQTTGLAALFNVHTPPSPQDILYGPLKAAFAAAWPANEEHSDPVLVKNFWALCREEKNKGTLVSGWKNTIFDSYGEIYASQNPALSHLHL